MTDFREIAKQLRRPEGDLGKQIGYNMNKGNGLMNKCAIEALGLKPGDHVLEIGMGNGAFVKELFAKEPAIQYTGSDFSETMIDEAKQINEGFTASGKARFILASFNDLPFPEQSFDVVFTINTIYFWDDAAAALREIKRILKKDGILLIGLRPESIMKDLPFTGYNFKLYSREAVEVLLAQYGLTVTKCIENDEPDQELGGAVLKMKSLIVIAGDRYGRHNVNTMRTQ